MGFFSHPAAASLSYGLLLPDRARQVPHLLSHDFKLARAYEHLRSLDAETDQWLETNPYLLTHVIEADTREEVVYAEPTAAPPPELGLILSDAIQNMRQALDHLVYALASANHRGKVPRKVAEDCMFPIYRDRPLSAQESARRLGGVNAVARAFIEELQPERHPKHSRSVRLWNLHELSRIDKHRQLQVVLLKFQGPAISLSGTFNATQLVAVSDALPKSSPKTIEGRTEIMRTVARDQREVDVGVRPVFGIGIEEADFTLRVIDELVWTWREIAQWIVEPLTPCLYPELVDLIPPRIPV